MVQSIAGKAVATKAISDFILYYLLAVLDSTRDACLRFETVVTPATRARLTISYIRTTEAAIHSAGSNQRRTNRICLSSWHYVSDQKLLFSSNKSISCNRD